MLGGAYLPTSQRTRRMAPVGKLVPLVVPLPCYFLGCEIDFSSMAWQSNGHFANGKLGQEETEKDNVDDDAYGR